MFSWNYLLKKLRIKKKHCNFAAIQENDKIMAAVAYDTCSQQSVDMAPVLNHIDVMLDEMWENGKLNQKRLDEISQMHLHTDL